MSDSSHIDLELLFRRESEQTEWKQGVANTNDVVRTLCAFANDLANLGGGYVVCGAAEEKDAHGFPVLRRSGLDANKLKEVESTVLARCRDRVTPPLHPRVEELEADSPDRRILIFVQPATQQVHQFREDQQSGKFYVRIGRQTLEARNGIQLELLSRRGGHEPWDWRICSSATSDDLDRLALREVLRTANLFTPETDVETYISSERKIHALVPTLCIREGLTGILRPRNFALLLFGSDPSRFIPGAVAILSRYSGRDRSSQLLERHELDGTLIEQIRASRGLLARETSQRTDKSDLDNPNSLKYPPQAIYEALGNAVAHRDYEQVDPTRITIFEDRLEFFSPGGLAAGLDTVAFQQGKLGPRLKNQALAWFFNRLQFAQAEGQGIPTILRSMSESGSPPPTFVVDPSSVTCTLPANLRHRRSLDLRDAERALERASLELARARAYVTLDEAPQSAEGWSLLLTARARLSDIRSRLTALGEAWRQLDPSTLLYVGSLLLEGSSPEQAQGQQMKELALQHRFSSWDLSRVCEALAQSDFPEAALKLFESDILSEHSAVTTSLRSYLQSSVQGKILREMSAFLSDARETSQPDSRLLERAERLRTFLIQAESLGVLQEDEQLKNHVLNFRKTFLDLFLSSD